MISYEVFGNIQLTGKSRTKDDTMIPSFQSAFLVSRNRMNNREPTATTHSAQPVQPTALMPVPLFSIGGGTREDMFRLNNKGFTGGDAEGQRDKNCATIVDGRRKEAHRPFNRAQYEWSHKQAQRILHTTSGWELVCQAP